MSCYVHGSIVEQIEYESLDIEMPNGGTERSSKSIDIFKRAITERTGTDIFNGEGKILSIKLSLDQDVLQPESFSISPVNDGVVFVKGGDENGLLYGLGKLLHNSSISNKHFVLGSWHGTSSPEKKVRGIYFATHFNNFYQSAPIDEVVKYIEELALWGYNSLQVWFDMHHFSGIDDPNAIELQERLAAFLIAGNSVGMKTGLTMLANEGYSTSPAYLRAKNVTFTDFYATEICPSLPGGAELIVSQVSDVLDRFTELGASMDRIWLWPYDQGGCTCEACSPWGSNGFLKITKKLSTMIKGKLPRTEIVLSTWLFDYKEQDKGEWRGLANAFVSEKPWVDYIMADSHTTYPSFLMNNEVPGRLPLLNFPEISMWGNFPWGAYGMNILPKRFDQLWQSVSKRVEGGYPYSEGIFEDANKILYSQFYWDSSKSAQDILKEYIAYEYSAKHVDDILKAINIMEQNYGMSSYRWARVPDTEKTIDISKDDHGAEVAYRILSEVDKQLPPTTVKSWRWRLLLLRSLLDYELRKTNGAINPVIEQAFQEISQLQYLDNAHFFVKPPINNGADYPVEKIHPER